MNMGLLLPTCLHCGRKWLEHRTGGRHLLWVWREAVPLACCVTSGELLALSGSQFPSLPVIGWRWKHGTHPVPDALPGTGVYVVEAHTFLG